MVDLILVALVGFLVTFLYLRHTELHPVEKLAYWFFSTIIQKLAFTIMVMNVNVVRMSQKLVDFITLSLSGLFFYSITMGILMSFLFSAKIKRVYKLPLFIVFILGLTGADYLFVLRGDVEYLNWNLWLNFCKQFVMNGLTYLFAILFRNLLHKERLPA